MPTPRGPLAQHSMLLLGCVLGAFSVLMPGPALAQPSGVDEAQAAAAPPVPAAAALDKVQGGLPPHPVLPEAPAEAPPPAPALATPGASPGPPPAAETGPSPLQLPDAGQISTTTLGPSAPGGPPGESVPPAAAAAPVPPMPVSIDHPQVIDTARLAGGQQSVTLFGVVGLPGEAAQGLQGFLASSGNRVTCQAQTAADFVCLLPDGTDVAEAALINGAARARDDAPVAYREQEAAAQAARRGLWSNLPPPPVVLKHPLVQDTATLVAERQTYVLDGLQGLGAPYVGQLQGYIAANGDTLTCNPQPLAGTYICVLNDGTDIAKVALVNGAALVSGDAPDTYRLQQREALLNQRGYWLHPAPEVVVAATAVIAQPSACCVFVTGDEGVDGIAYVGGVPTALIEGETEFLVFAGDDVGWGYYDHGHRWHGAPDRYRGHLEHFHPGGHGLRGYDHGMEHGAEGMHHPGDMHPTTLAGGPGHAGGMGPGGHTGGMAGGIGPGGHTGGMAGGMGPGGHTGGMAGGIGPGGHTGGMAGGMGPGGHTGGMAGGIGPGGHTGGMAGGIGPGGHTGGMGPGMGPGGHTGGMAGGIGPGGHTGGMAGGMGAGGHTGGMGQGGGFVHPGPSAGGFHPAAPPTSGGGHSGGGGGGGGSSSNSKHH